MKNIIYAIIGFTLLIGGFILSSSNNKNKSFTNNNTDDKRSDDIKIQPQQSISSIPPPTTKTIQSGSNTKQISIEQKENFNSYINPSILNSSETDVSVFIIDEYGNFENSVSNHIANIYSNLGNRASTGLIRNSFIRNSKFIELMDGNSNIISKLDLDKYTDYLAIGKISFSFRSGKVVEGTFICSASLNVNIINIGNKSISKSINITNVNANGSTESQAKESAIQKLLEKYQQKHSTI